MIIKVGKRLYIHPWCNAIINEGGLSQMKKWFTKKLFKDLYTNPEKLYYTILL